MKKLIVTLLFLGIVGSISPSTLAADRDIEINHMLTSAESLFKSMKVKNYSVTWSLLSQKSKNHIISDVCKECKKAGAERQENEVRSDFETAGTLSQAYWNSFLREFDPDMALLHSEWRIGAVEKRKAVIVIQYEKSERPALLLMFKENGKWKVGLEETFRARRLLPSIKK